MTDHVLRETAVPKSRTSEETVKSLEGFVRNSLPQLNQACRDGRISLRAWLTPAGTAVDGALAAVLASRELRPRVQQLAGFVLESAERHAQATGAEPGEILKEIPGLDAALLVASDGERVPQLTSELYWTENTGEQPLSFTGERHEWFFIKAVNTQTRLRAATNELLRAVTDEVVSPSDPQCAALLNVAAASVHVGHEQYLAFRKGPDGVPLMTEAEFNEMRGWLTKTEIQGVVYTGPNAAYVPEMVVTDFLIGTADDDYLEYVQGFSAYLSPAARSLADADRSRSSVISELAKALGYADVTAMAETDIREFLNRVLTSSISVRLAILAFKKLFGAFVGESGAHYRLVQINLIKYADTLSPTERAALTVDPGIGVGGNNHGHTLQLHNMRRQCPGARRLIEAARRLESS